MSMEFLETPWTQPSRPKKVPTSTAHQRWLGGDIIQAQVNAALEGSGITPTIEVDSKTVKKAVADAAVSKSFQLDTLEKIAAKKTDLPKGRTKPAYPTDGKTYVWNEPLWRWDLVEDPAKVNPFEGKELVVIRNGEVITVGLNGRSMEDAIAEEMAIEGTEAVSENKRITEIPVKETELTTEQQTAWDTFEKNFEGLEGMDELRAAVMAGRVDPSTLPTDASTFNDQIRSEAGILPGGWSPTSGFYTSRSEAGYVDTRATEPIPNPTDKSGNVMWISKTFADGRTGWIRNVNFVDPDATGPGSEESIARTIAATDAEAAAAAAAAGVESATAILTRLAGAFGLPTSVVTKLKKMMVDGLSEEAIALEIRQTEEYAARFPGMKLRQDAGFASITEAAYMANEDEYAMLLRTHGLPERFYDDRMDFATLIAQDVSPNEFGERVTLAELATKGADPNTKEELKRLFDVDETDLVAYYLDPEQATNLIEERRAFEAAGLSATGARVLGQEIGFDKETALALQREGIQRREIQQRLTPQAGLVTQLLGEEDGISAADLASGEFGLNPETANKIRRRREGRQAGFAGHAGMLISGSGATGFGAST